MNLETNAALGGKLQAPLPCYIDHLEEHLAWNVMATTDATILKPVRPQKFTPTTAPQRPLSFSGGKTDIFCWDMLRWHLVVWSSAGVASKIRPQSLAIAALKLPFNRAVKPCSVLVVPLIFTYEMSPRNTKTNPKVAISRLVVGWCFPSCSTNVSIGSNLSMEGGCPTNQPTNVQPIRLPSISTVVRSIMALISSVS